ncbi:hypothetical protein H2201_008720 [Coniosporium apollinis]|uniref:Uncharacterized protein n=1 Tax=Coniosporium apollinis TaxID=61459 RepID=A0ABQ9NI66_9PEZI|nr:hypothetical protein H2201_008720 [Coniosporium apollinis]
MSPTEEKSFFLYGIGRKPDVLCLGNLVLKDYANPTAPGRHYTHGVLRQVLLMFAASKPALLADRRIAKTRKKVSLHFGLVVDAAEIVDLDLSWASNKKTILAAEAGERVELKDPKGFLNDHVIKDNPKSQQMLRLWLTAPTLKRIVAKFGLRKPRIWMLTGLYELERTRCYMMKSSETGTSAGISSIAVAAMTGVVPVGGGFDLGSGHKLEKQNIALDEPHVWAAQYRQLEASYLHVKNDKKEPKLPETFALYPDVLSEGVLRKGAEDDFNAFTVSLQIGDEHMNETDTSQRRDESEQLINDDEYDKELEEALIDLQDLYMSSNDNEDKNGEGTEEAAEEQEDDEDEENQEL